MWWLLYYVIGILPLVASSQPQPQPQTEAIPVSLPDAFPSPAIDCHTHQHHRDHTHTHTRSPGLVSCVFPLGPIGAAQCARAIVGTAVGDVLGGSVPGFVDVARGLCGCFPAEARAERGRVCESAYCCMSTLICGSGFLVERCAHLANALPGITAPRPSALPPSTQSADLFLTDLTGSVPATIPADIVEREGLTYYVLIRLLMNFYASPCSGGGVGALPEPPIPGWRTVHFIRLIETPEWDDSGLRETPFVQVVAKEDGSELLLLVRGTVTLTEARLETYRRQVAFLDIIHGATSHRQADECGLWGGCKAVPLIREGYGAILRAVFPSIRRIVDSYASTAERVIVAGFSLGASVASYIALGLAMATSPSHERHTADNSHRIDLVAVSPVRAFNQPFADLMTEKVNPRTLVYEADPIPQWACKTAVGCRANQPPPQTDTMGTVEYVDFPGRVEIRRGDLGEPNEMGGSLHAWPAHMCAYICWAVRRFAADDGVDWCLLRGRGHTGGGMRVGVDESEGEGEGSICPYSVERLPLLV
mmetsp:Transcript_20239/g.57894  ORF Transcript_20239/g.57894 Transcript_20239/m.57894 type:complete len:534 (-) Transcript_20239:2141-3742(-)